jgi:hypothetical protein
MDSHSLQSVTDPPPEFQSEEHDFFTSGRYLRIWARDGANVDVEIHNKSFIILDTKNKEGPGLLVHPHGAHCNSRKGSFTRSHVLLKNHPGGHETPSSTKDKTCYLEEGDDPVEENTFIELEHIYNIPFVKYKCVDLGALTTESLDDLRRHYVNWLINLWRLGKTIPLLAETPS